jgi:hypothetical protein
VSDDLVSDRCLLQPDPECRPTIADVFASFAALAGGRPLPDWSPSPEALECRQRRLEAAILKEQKQQANKKPAYNAVPARKSPQALDNNSVAAKRLAAKRGAGAGNLSPAIDFTASNSPASFQQTKSQPSAPSSLHFETFANFDAFGTNSSAPQQQQDTGFDAFGGEKASARGNQADVFDTFGGGKISAAPASVSADSLFDEGGDGDSCDAFANPQSTFGAAAVPPLPVRNGSFSATTISAPDTSPRNSFRASSGSARNSPRTSPRNSFSTSQNADFGFSSIPASAASFDAFDSHSNPAPTNVFADFDASTGSSAAPSSVFDSFATSAAPVAPLSGRAPPSSSLTSLFDAVPAKQATPVDIFGSSSDLLIPTSVAAAPGLQTNRSNGAVDLLNVDLGSTGTQSSKPKAWLGDADLLSLTISTPAGSSNGLNNNKGVMLNNSNDPFASAMGSGGRHGYGGMGGNMGAQSMMPMNGGVGSSPMGMGMGGPGTGMGMGPGMNAMGGSPMMGNYGNMGPGGPMSGGRGITPSNSFGASPSTMQANRGMSSSSGTGYQKAALSNDPFSSLGVLKK